MTTGQGPDEKTAQTTALASRVFLSAESSTWRTARNTTLLAIGSAAISLWTAATKLGAADSVVATIDRLLFVFMLVEILHTVRVSFRTGILVCEPFLIVGLIASIRRVLVITLKSTQLDISYRGSALSRDDRDEAAPLRAGDRAPDATKVMTIQGERRLFDLTRGGRLTLLNFGTPLVIGESRFGLRHWTSLDNDLRRQYH